MNTINDINSLLQSIRGTIKSYREGRLSLKRTIEDYDKKLLQYKELEQSIISLHSQGFLKGLLYHHNVNNYSKLTALFYSSRKDLSVIDYYGDDKLLEILPELIIRKFKLLEENKVNKIFLHNRKGLTYNLFIRLITIKSKNFFLGTVTSSHYFNLNDFQFYSELIRKICINSIKLNLPMSFDYYNGISVKLTNYVNHHIEKKGAVTANIFVFKDIVKIFGHMGISTLADISRSLSNTLKNSFPDNAEVFIPSINTYIVLKPENSISDDSSVDNSKNKIQFSYNDITIFYKEKQHFIDSSQLLYDFWEEILLFENSILTEGIKQYEG